MIGNEFGSSYEASSEVYILYKRRHRDNEAIKCKRITKYSTNR